MSGPVSTPSLDALADVLARCGSPRFFVPVAPVVGHEPLSHALEQRGLRHYNNWMRLMRRVADPPDPPKTDLHVREIDRSSASSFGAIVSAAFGYPPAMAPLVGQTVGRSGWRHYLAYDGATPVAAAAMYLAGDAAWFGFAATDAAHGSGAPNGRWSFDDYMMRRSPDVRRSGSKPPKTASSKTRHPAGT